MATRRSAAAQAVPARTIPHPKENPHLYGHEAMEAALANSFAEGKLPHALLVCGSKGIGKATLCYRLARHVLKGGSDNAGQGGLFGDAPAAPSMEMAAEDPFFRRFAIGGHADFLAVEPAFDARKGTYKNEVVIDDVRKVGEFLALTPAESEWRVVVVDSADAMNRNAANALLKILEEPPQRALLLLVSHNPGKLLPTIRSRCRMVKLKPVHARHFATILSSFAPDIPPEDIRALELLSEGSPGLALSLREGGAVDLYARLVALLAKTPALDSRAVSDMVGSLAGREEGGLWPTARQLLLMLLSRLVAYGAGGRSVQEVVAGEAELMQKLLSLRPVPYWVEMWEKAGRLLDDAERIHLDRHQVLATIFHGFEGIELP